MRDQIEIAIEKLQVLQLNARSEAYEVEKKAAILRERERAFGDAIHELEKVRDNK